MDGGVCSSLGSIGNVVGWGELYGDAVHCSLVACGISVSWLSLPEQASAARLASNATIVSLRCCNIKMLSWAKRLQNKEHNLPLFFFFLSVPSEQLRQLLSESQEQLEAAKMESQKQSKELFLVREGHLEVLCLGSVCKPSCGAGTLLLGWWRGGRHSQHRES